VALIAGGVGITPMMSVTRYLTETGWPGDIHLILSFRTPEDFIFQDEIKALKARKPKLRVTVTMSRAGGTWNGRKGQIDSTLLAEGCPIPPLISPISADRQR
jgi:ferredoxin-NADP reductase